MRPHNSAILLYLRAKSDLYYGKVLELEQTIQGWLSYIPNSFPHYTRHTIEHSEELVVQASKLIFRDDNPNEPTVNLSPLEAYVIITTAYLHDSGMVVADQEKLEILTSDAWNDWVSGDGGGAARYRDIDNLRQSNWPANEAEGNFLADVQTRYLLAEFVRRIHHLRAGTIIRQHQASLGRFALDDVMLQRTIADICTAHGLPRHELEDQERFPERRDIRDETINVRLVAILLRLADLLDMSSDRACPLLLNAACPLPADSLAHWTQYQRILHRLTAPDKIAITAECHTQDEHRVLQDWCQWIVDEVSNARALMARSSRHKDWQPPRATLDGTEPTIIIRPAPTASYIPSKWTFELDQQSVFERLIHDVYQHPLTFIRELIQNGLDANRCQMYSDLKSESISPPLYPTEVEDSRRGKYPLHVTLENRVTINPLSGEEEKKQVLIVEDRGLGMDREIIQRYFLQVGRSYYTTEEFRRNFNFVPTSRFGVGFLSVFAVSDHVTIETYKAVSLIREGPVRLTLTGPRNYLLTEKGYRNTPGTKIEVLLKEKVEAGVLTKLVGSWCRRVEFPIVVNDLGAETLIRAEQPSSFLYEMPDVTQKKSKFVLRCFPINRPGLEGEIYIHARVNDKTESWADWNWTYNTYPKLHPQAVPPPRIESLVCVNGIAIDQHAYSTGPLSVRADYRARADHLDLSRQRIRQRGLSTREQDPNLTGRIEELLRDHLKDERKAQGDDSWVYKQQLIGSISLPAFWESVPGTIRVYQSGKSRLLSLQQVQAIPVIRTVLQFANCSTLFNIQNPFKVMMLHKNSKRTEPQSLRIRSRDPLLYEEDINLLSASHRQTIFRDRFITSIKWDRRRLKLILKWGMGKPDDELFKMQADRPVLFAQFDEAGVIGARIHKTKDNVYETVVLNSRNELVQWLVRLQNATDSGTYAQGKNNVAVVLELLSTVLRYHGHELSKLLMYLDQWRQIGLPAEMAPPPLPLKKTKFFVTRALMSN